MAKDQKLKEFKEFKELTKKIDSIHSHFTALIVEKEKKIYAKISQFEHDIHLFKQKLLDKPAKKSAAKTGTVKKPRISPVKKTVGATQINKVKKPAPIKPAMLKKASVKKVAPKKAAPKKTLAKTITVATPKKVIAKK